MNPHPDPNARAELPRRKRTLLDAMILIAALAAGISWTQALVPIIRERGGMNSPMWRMMPRQASLFWWPAAAVPILMTLSLGLLACRARQPRPGWSTIARQPGAAACLVALAVFCFQATMVIAGKALGQLPNTSMPGGGAGGDFGFLIWRLSGDLTSVGYGVLGAWLVLALGRVREPENSWVDRVGRLLGASWIALLAIQRVAPYIRA